MAIVEERTGRLSAQDALALWSEYKQTGDKRLRDRLILTFAPMVKYIVYKKVQEIPTRSDVEDFISCGLEALIRSIDRYDPEKGASLEQFAWTRIHGAVLDELRSNDWAPRSLRRWDRDISKANEQFIGLYGRHPTRAELSEALGITSEELVSRQDEIARSWVGSLNVTVADDEVGTERIDTLRSEDRDVDPEFAAMRSQAKARFRRAFELLPVRERKIAVMLYVHNLTLREIGVIIGVSESRVCQLHGEVTKKLRVALDCDEQLFRDVA